MWYVWDNTPDGDTAHYEDWADACDYIYYRAKSKEGNSLSVAYVHTK